MSRKRLVKQMLCVVFGVIAAQAGLLIGPALSSAAPSPGRWMGTVTFTDHTSGKNQAGDYIL